MERVTFAIKLRPGCKEEYKRRHDEIWPEMIDLMKRQGIRNYTIWYLDDILFAYYETDDKEASDAVAEADPVVRRWQAHMADIIEIIKGPDGKAMQLEQMFLFDPQA